MKRYGSEGFTLIELLVAVALLAIVFIGVLNMLDMSANVSKVEAALADTQENVRFAAYHIVRTARMTGGGEMPFARAGAWVAGQIVDDSVSIPSIADVGTLNTAPGSDVLVLRGFFENSPFFTSRFDINNPSNGSITIRERRTVGDASSDIVNPLDDLPTNDDALVGSGVVFMGRRMYRVGRVSGSSLSGADPNRTLVLNYVPGGTLYSSMNPDGNAIAADGPAFDTYRVGLLQMYVYFVSPDLTLRRISLGPGGFENVPVAVNIGSLQVSVGLDTNNDGDADTFDSDPTPGDIVGLTSMRISVLGRTPFEVRALEGGGGGAGWREPDTTFAFEDDPVNPAAFNRAAKWRRMDVLVTLRNFSL
jgi:prepilin-type N-terminal cleavage/methylation domain-containing protein